MLKSFATKLRTHILQHMRNIFFVLVAVKEIALTALILIFARNQLKPK
jgi:hypothetical protein